MKVHNGGCNNDSILRIFIYIHISNLHVFFNAGIY